MKKFGLGEHFTNKDWTKMEGKNLTTAPERSTKLERSVKNVNKIRKAVKNVNKIVRLVQKRQQNIF